MAPVPPDSRRPGLPQAAAAAGPGSGPTIPDGPGDGSRRAEILLRRWSALGLDPRPGPGGRSWLLTLPLRPEGFELPSGTRRRFATLQLATVGEDRAKCIRPRAFFHLPLLRIVDCASAEEIEARVRAAWSQRLEALGRARRWLERMGATPIAPEDAPVLELAIGQDARAALLEPGRVVLPGRGLLSGIALRRPEDRLLPIDAGTSSAVELEIAVTTRLETLARLHHRLARDERLLNPADETATRDVPSPVLVREPPRRVLLVGSRLAGEREVIDALRRRGLEVAGARTAQEALRAFEAASPEIVVAETHIGRFEGIELVPALRGLPGVEEIPVVLLDDRPREERREAARRAGAAGYLARPLDLSKLVSGLDQLVRHPRRRRFTRYVERVAVRPQEGAATWVTAELGRGGMFVWLDRDRPLSDLGRYRIELSPAVGTVDVDAQVVYRRSGPGAARQGAGLRFRAFPNGGEGRFIAYLRSLDGARASA